MEIPFLSQKPLNYVFLVWEEYCKNNQKTITIDGSERHLVKIRKFSAYVAPAKEDKPEENYKNQKRPWGQLRCL
jgi:hypothetical protein